MPNFVNLVMLCIVAFAGALHYPQEAIIAEQVVILIQAISFGLMHFISDSLKTPIAFLSFQLLYVASAFALGIGYVTITQPFSFG